MTIIRPRLQEGQKNIISIKSSSSPTWFYATDLRRQLSFHRRMRWVYPSQNHVSFPCSFRGNIHDTILRKDHGRHLNRYPSKWRKRFVPKMRSILKTFIYSMPPIRCIYRHISSHAQRVLQQQRSVCFGDRPPIHPADYVLPRLKAWGSEQKMFWYESLMKRSEQ